MFKSRFFWQLYSGYVAVVAICAAIVSLNLANWNATDAMQAIRVSLRTQAELLEEIARPMLGGAAEPGFQEQIGRLGASIGTRLTVISADGLVLADSAEAPGAMDRHDRREEIIAAREHGSGYATRLSATVAQDMLYFARRVDGSDRVIGFVRTARPLRGVDRQIAAVRGLAFQSAIVAVLVALAIGLLAARRVMSPITSMTDVVGRIAAGEYSRRVPAKSADEIGQLAMAFNAMAEQMEARIAGVTEGRNTLGAILSGMVEGVVAVDPEERIVHMNAVAGDLLQVDPERAVGERVREVTWVNEVGEALAGSLSSGEEVSSQAHLHLGGEERLVEITATPLRSSTGALTGAVVVLHDVTAMRRLEGVRREFVVNASHELKTPITAIRGFLETLVADPDMPADIRANFLSRATAQSDRLSALVTDLLQLSRLESGNHLVATDPVDLRSVVRRTIDELSVHAESKGIEISAAIPADKVLVRGDASALALILDNLVNNAIKYTDEGGHVGIRLSIDRAAVLIEVEDDGIGIAKVHLDRIFERFYRVDKARSRELGGTGLGLAIVKHACGLLHGTLRVESELGVGSTFRVRLPRAGGDTAAAVP